MFMLQRNILSSSFNCHSDYIVLTLNYPVAVQCSVLRLSTMIWCLVLNCNSWTTSGSSSLLQKLVVAQLVRTMPFLMEYEGTRATYCSLFSTRWVHAPRLISSAFPSRKVHMISSSHACYDLCPSYPSSFDWPHNISRIIQIIMLFVMHHSSLLFTLP
jgi:hypothetical protein